MVYTCAIQLNDGNDMKALKIGEVAKSTGLTVRTLHHYDEIGLLTPANRTKSGYRLYTGDDLIRLQKIKSLQHMGLSLQHIAQVINQENYSLSTMLTQHIENIKSSITQQELLLKRLKRIALKLTKKTPPSEELILESLQMLITFEKYYTPKQLDVLTERRKNLGESSLKNMEKQWGSIFYQYEKFLEKGIPASAKQVKKLAQKALGLVDVFTGGDPEIEKSLQKMIDGEGWEKLFNRADKKISQAVFDYYLSSIKLVRSEKV